MVDPVIRLNAALKGRYRIERQLGEGGMATVYLADDLRHERKVALKVLKPELAAVVGAERFLAEIKTTANLQHPHILPLFDSGEADSFLFYVMPYVEGESLRQRLDREHQLPVDEAVRIATNLAEALDYAHSHGVIHRDVKPANILLQAGKPLLSDFGIAIAVGAAGGGRLTETGLSLGTPHYMSPEQATGDVGVGAATDIYALGCVLYETLVGEPPFTGSTPQAVLGKIVTGDADPVAKHRKSVPPNVDAAIRKALEKVPADRFGGPSSFVQALNDPVFAHGQLLRDAGSPRAGLLNPLSVGASAAAMVFAATTLWSLLRPSPEIIPQRFEVTYPVEPNSRSGVSFDISPDGRRIVFQSDSPSDLWLRPVQVLSAERIEGTDGARNPRFSPDGSMIAFIRDGQVWVLPEQDRGPARLVVSDSVQQSYSGLAWDANGKVYYRRAGMGIWRSSTDGGDPEEVTRLSRGEAAHQWPDVLPNGRGVLFTRDLGPPTADSIALYDLETGEQRTLFQGAMARYVRSGHILYTLGDGQVMAVPFDQDGLQFTGPTRPLPDGPVMVSSESSGSYFAVSASGSLLYRPSGFLSELTPIWIGRGGSEETLSTSIVGRFEAPALSPDGQKLALQYAPDGSNFDQIWIYDLEHGDFFPVTSEGDNIRPFWSSDGERIGFLSDRAGPRAAFSRAADGSGDVTLLHQDSIEPILEAEWTPDMRRLVYRRSTSGQQAVGIHYVALHPDSSAVAIVEGGFNVWAPTLSPDGSWLAYNTNQSGRYEIAVRPFPGPGREWRVTLEGGSRPVWASNRELFYIGPDGDWMVAAVSYTDSTFDVESRTSWASAEGFGGVTTTQQYDVDPDGQRLVALRARSDLRASVRDVVVLSFFEELNRLVPAN